jgi:hypothetical protein
VHTDHRTDRTSLLPPLTDGLYVFVAVLVASLALFVLAVLLAPGPAGASLVQRTDKVMRHTQHCERLADRDRSPTPSRRLYARTKAHPAFRNWAFRLWHRRANRACGRVRYLNAFPPRAIAYVFRRVGQAATALIVAQREGGGGYCTRAWNPAGYFGCFQMGWWARSRYGHGPTALDQSWAAFWYVREARGWCSGWAATAPGC